MKPMSVIKSKEIHRNCCIKLVYLLAVSTKSYDQVLSVK